MVADLSNPATLNRYAYGFNNPLRYTDPSGHCNVDGTDGDDPNECEKRLSQLTDYNVSVINYHLGAWSLVELDIVLEALGAMLKAFNWSLKKFHEKIGDVFIEQISDRSTPAIGGKQSPAVAWPSLTGTHIIFAQDAFGSRPGVLNKDYFKRTVIHEFAHAWDFNAKLFNSSRIAKYAGLQDHYGRDHYTTPYGETRRQEDWAESVSETVMNTNGVDAGRKALVNRIAQE